jgi:hypothetical protein
VEPVSEMQRNSEDGMAVPSGGHRDSKDLGFSLELWNIQLVGVQSSMVRTRLHCPSHLRLLVAFLWLQPMPRDLLHCVQGRGNEAVVFVVPYVLLQLPPACPEQHPARHPIQLAPLAPNGHRALRNGCPVVEMPLTASEHTVLSASKLALCITVDPGTEGAEELQRPIFYVAAVQLLQASSASESPEQGRLAASFSLDAATVELAVQPSQLRMLLALVEQDVELYNLLSGKLQELPPSSPFSPADRLLKAQNSKHSSGARLPKQWSEGEAQQSVPLGWSVCTRLGTVAVHLGSDLDQGQAASLLWTGVLLEVQQSASAGSSGSFSWSQAVIRLTDSLADQQCERRSSASSPVASPLRWLSPRPSPSRDLGGTGPDVRGHAASDSSEQQLMSGSPLQSEVRAWGSDHGAAGWAGSLKDREAGGSVQRSGSTPQYPSSSSVTHRAASSGFFSTDGVGTEFYDADDFEATSFVSVGSVPGAAEAGDPMSSEERGCSSGQDSVDLLVLKGMPDLVSRTGPDLPPGVSWECGVGTGNTAMEVVAAGLLIRGCLEGWDVVMERADEFLAVLISGAALSSSFQRPVPTSPNGAASAVSEQGPRLHLDARSVRMEVIDNGLAGKAC